MKKLLRVSCCTEKSLDRWWGVDGMRTWPKLLEGARVNKPVLLLERNPRRLTRFGWGPRWHQFCGEQGVVEQLKER